MRILANLLALALVGDEPPTSKTPTVPTGSIQVGAQEIPLGGFEPAASVNVSALPRIAKPSSLKPEPTEEWKLGLREAIRIGLENSEIIRVTRPAAPVGVVGAEPPHGSDIEIAPSNRDAPTWNFQSAAMAHVRSIEQQYWALWQQQVAVEAREAAVKQGEEILARERADLEVGHATTADIAEAEQQLENFKLNLVTAVSDLITLERHFRNILGLPAADNRRIVADTPPTEARIEPDWESCLREMNASHPDIARQKTLVRLNELQWLLARNQLLPLMGPNELQQLKGLGPVGDQASPVAPGVDFLGLFAKAVKDDPAGVVPAPRPVTDATPRMIGLAWMQIGMGRAPLANTRQAQYHLLWQRGALHQVVHQATHSLARSFLEVDAGHKQFATARRLNVAARQRLEAQRAFYDEGRITVDRLLDAISQQANAIAQEAQYLAGYNTSIAALEEAKGTVLAYDRIGLADAPSLVQVAGPKDDFLAPAAFEKPAEPPAPVAAPRSGVKTFKLKAKLGPGGLDLDIEVRECPQTRSVDPGR